ncbi:glycosyltransferase family 2 protein [Candidatus Pelagibacter ubique]|nr:glycosyltransferase family 2 protein [Candidatus Pelagibacter ubique]
MKVSIIIPVYNEEKTILKIINKILQLKNINKELIIVNDGSTDNTKKLLRKFSNERIRIINHIKNSGKGAAIRTAQKHVTGTHVIIQDADLEYEPSDYKNLLKPFKKKYISVVYGSRVLKKKRYRLKSFSSFERIFYNHVLTIMSNIINDQRLTDAHTCYKVFKSDIFKSIRLEENGFAFCPEITTKISNLNINIHEVPISYRGRDYSEGKKITYIDGIKAIYALFNYKFKSY